MNSEERRWLLTVPTGGDTLRQERLTVDLLETLRVADACAVEFAQEQRPAEPGSKSAGVGDVALWASVAAASRPAAHVLITAIKEWCASRRERSLEVNVSSDGHSFTVTGSPNAAQERMMREFLDKMSPESPGPDEEEPS